tara:strand:- start:864 stop:1016 length:153 start_codon:yes stop_codon:yes gene_type:complete
MDIQIRKLQPDEAFKISNIEQIEIDVTATVTIAEKLYQKMSFSTYGTHKN